MRVLNLTRVLPAGRPFVASPSDRRGFVMSCYLRRSTSSYPEAGATR